ncbi:MAG: hypothetical protein CFH31_00215 [Alphaproteobacteria bacterium MarineAlpha9_Bin1]|nr:MAG: hypothetical protein CFH31_00215 [Alphaproteobacteria bacterium MarineAlpha9_Bin1]
MSKDRIWKIYLSGEIHTNWREEIKKLCKHDELPVIINSPNTNHSNSDDCGVTILGNESNKFWHDRKGAAINSIRNSILLKETDILIVKFGDQYKQWNAAFDVGLAAAQGKAVITLHDYNLDHALKEIDQASLATCRSVEEVVAILRYVIYGKLHEKDEKAAE